MSIYEDYDGNRKRTFAGNVLNYLKVTGQALKKILVVSLKGTFFALFFAVIGGGLGYLLASHPTLWVRVIVGGLMIVCFIIWTSLWDPGCSYNRRRYMGMNKH